MNKLEIAKLLTIVSGFDRRQVDDVTVEAWFLVPGIRDADYEDAVAVVVAHFSVHTKDYLTVAHVVAGTALAARATGEMIAVDVRAARGRKMIPSDWPESKPLPDDVRLKLAAARLGELREAREIESGDGDNSF